MSYDIYNYTGDVTENKYGFAIGSNGIPVAGTDVWLSPDTRLVDAGADAFVITANDPFTTLLWSPQRGFAIHNYDSDPEVPYIPPEALQLLQPRLSDLKLETVDDLIKAFDTVEQYLAE